MENGKTWPMAETILSYLLAELESSNPQRISKKIGGTDIEAKALFLLLVEGILTRQALRRLSGCIARRLARYTNKGHQGWRLY
jgi:hypothetical protein